MAKKPAKTLEEAFLPELSLDDMALKTLSGDIRDAMLTRFRNMTVPWGRLNEDEQRGVNYAMDDAAKRLVRRTVALLTQAKFPTLMVSVGAVKIDKGVEIKLGCTDSVENIVALAQHGKGSAVLVLAEASAYFGEKAPAPVDRDQPDLPGSQDEAA